jgi:hypothetical protein
MMDAAPWGWMPDKRNAQAVSSPKGEKLAEKKCQVQGRSTPKFLRRSEPFDITALKKIKKIT